MISGLMTQWTFSKTKMEKKVKTTGFCTEDGYAAVPWGKKFIIIHQGQQLEVVNTETAANKFIKNHRTQPQSGTVFL